MEMRELTDEELEKIYKYVGRFAVTWAGIETALDGCNAMFYWSGAREHVTAEVPRSLEKKLKFFAKALQMEKFKLFADQGEQLARRIHILKRDRHDAIHGSLSEFNEATQAFAHAIVEYQKDGYAIRERDVTLDQIADWCKEAEALMLDMTKFVLWCVVKHPDQRNTTQ
jgi:hypothetical protein